MLVSHDAVLLHCASLDTDRGGVLLSAQTDTGKTSTILRLLDEAGSANTSSAAITNGASLLKPANAWSAEMMPSRKRTIVAPNMATAGSTVSRTMTTMRMMSSLAEVADAFRSARRITAICHENPDADTIGAAVAVRLIALRLGAEAEIVSVDRPAPMFDFLPGMDEVQPRPRLEPDLAVVCDAATLARVGRIAVEEAEWLGRARLLNVDHHVTSDYFGDLNLVDPHAAATCEVLARLVPELGIELDAPLASALLTGIVRDSQGFADPSTSPDTLRLTATLVEAGAPLPRIHRRILMEMPFGMMALWGRILSTTGEALGGRVVHATLTQPMLDETGTAAARRRRCRRVHVPIKGRRCRDPRARAGPPRDARQPAHDPFGGRDRHRGRIRGRRSCAPRRMYGRRPGRSRAGRDPRSHDGGPRRLAGGDAVGYPLFSGR